MTVEAFAPAKINLTLHVTGQRGDGYHLLDSLVVFADVGDWVSVAPADGLSLEVTGPMAQGVPADAGNLVMQAAETLGLPRGATLTLEKNLPAASGIGGGSSDAAATLRALSELWETPLPDRETQLALGADVPVCMAQVPQRMQGIGEILSPVSGLPAFDMVLVNPRVEVSTPAVFGSLLRRDNPPMPERLPELHHVASLAAWLRSQRNDLQEAAIAQQPAIAAALEAIRGTNSLFTAMSGSGATCLGLFPSDGASAHAAARQIQSANPDWWVAPARRI